MEIKRIRDKRNAKKNEDNAHKQNQNGIGSMDAKAYFAEGSIRNTAHDHEFFRVFTQYLEEAIIKLKEQQNDDDPYGEEGEDENNGEEEEEFKEADDGKNEDEEEEEENAE